MKRGVFAALALFVAAPHVLNAQVPAPEPSIWGARVRVTPYFGLAPAASRVERWTVLANGVSAPGEYSVDLGAGPAVGASVEVRLVDRFAIIASGTMIARGRTTEYSVLDAQFFQHNGGNYLIGKAALAMRLREAVSEMQLRRMTATLFFGPAYVLEMPKDDIALDPVMLDPIGHYGLNFGFDAEIPIAGGRVSLQGGMEDFFTWWNADTWAARNDRAYANDGFNTVSFVDVNPSHMLLLRAGVSVKF